MTTRCSFVNEATLLSMSGIQQRPADSGVASATDAVSSHLETHSTPVFGSRGCPEPKECWSTSAPQADAAARQTARLTGPPDFASVTGVRRRAGTEYEQWPG